MTGARSIEYRHSWSSQNNSIMLSRLITLIEQHIGTIYTPWTNMNIVISKDASEFRLNYLDREIILDPTDVPDQWLVVLQSVNPGAIKEVEEQLPKFEVLQSKFESMAQNALLRGLCSTASAENSGSELLVPSAPAVHVTVKRGFTCSTTSYYYFLHQMNRKLDVTVEPGAMLGAENSAQRYTCSDAVNGEQRVQVRPMDVFVIIEDSHGTKLLPDGTFRIDVRADSDAVQALLVKGSSSLSELVKSHNSTQRAIEVLTESLASVIKWQSIRTGVGVDIGQFLVFLQRLDEYVRLPECKAALLQLEGLRVVVGHYLGMADDGACILPWEICLPTGGADENENEDDNSTAGDVL